MGRRRVIGVIGAGEGCRQEDRELAWELGERIACEGWILLSGGRDAGVMGAANEGAKRVEGSLTIGILPGDDVSGASPHVDVPVITGMGSARNNVIVLTAEVVIACGAAGSGTTSEIALALKAGKRVIWINSPANGAAFFNDLGGGRLLLAGSAAEAVELARF